MKEWSFPQRLTQGDQQDINLVHDPTPSGFDAQSIQLFEDKEAADAAKEIRDCLASGDTSRALLVCDRMLALHPGNRLFEGLRLEVDGKEREVRLEFIRRLGADLEDVPDLDYRINAIQQALNRYPMESQLSQLLRTAKATRDFFTGLVAEARQEEMADKFTEALKRWYVIRELFPALPGLESEIHRVEALTHAQTRMRRRADFVEAINRLSSTGEYARAVYQCVNALSEFPNDLGLLALKKNAEEKVRYGSELQRFISDGLTFLQGHEADAALESFVKAKELDQNNLQVRYLIGIALLDKARTVMYKDRQKLNALLTEARDLIPDHPELESLSFALHELTDEGRDESPIRVNDPVRELQPRTMEPAPQAAQEDAVQAATSVRVEAVPEPEPVAASERPFHAVPNAPDNPRSFRYVLFGVAVLGFLVIALFVYSNSLKGPNTNGSVSAGVAGNVDIRATPEGAEIFVDGQKLGQSQVQTQLTRGSHTVTASLAGYDSQTLSVEPGTETKPVRIILRAIPLDLHIVTDQPGSTVWVNDENKGDTTEKGITISGVLPGTRLLRISTGKGELEIGFDFTPGKAPTAKSLPPRQIATVFFAGSADGKSHVECNCAPAGVRVGALAELIRAGGVEIPLAEGPHEAELWIGKSQKNFTIRGGGAPVATIAVFSANP